MKGARTRINLHTWFIPFTYNNKHRMSTVPRFRHSYPSSWETLVRRFNSRALMVEGDHDQPVYRFSFRFEYQQTRGQFIFTWENTKNDRTFVNINLSRSRGLGVLLPFDTPDLIPGHIYNPETTLLLELAETHDQLKISPNTRLRRLLSRFNSHRVLTGNAGFDAAFITIARPASIVPALMPGLSFLKHPSVNHSPRIDTDWEDAETARFNLRLRTKCLFNNNAVLEKMLADCSWLVQRLNHAS